MTKANTLYHVDVLKIVELYSTETCSSYYQKAAMFTDHGVMVNENDYQSVLD